MPETEMITLSLADLRALIREILSSIHCCAVGFVESFDPQTQTACVRPAMRSRGKDGSDIPAPLLRDVPVFFPGGKASAMTYPISPGDECLVVFNDFCIDGWFETGTATQPPSGRRHDWSDAFAFVGFRSRPNALQDFSENPSFFGQRSLSPIYVTVSERSLQ